MPKRPLAPRFITQLDDYLLINRPDTWSSRIHLVVYYTLIYSVALGLICAFMPNDPLRDSNIEFWIMAQSVMVIVAIVLWIVYLVRFNTFKSFGTVYPGDRIKTYAFYFIALLLMTGTVWIPPLAETYRTRIQYSPSEVVEDMNEMNVLLARLVRNETPAEITMDSIFIIDYATYVPPATSDAYTWDDSIGGYVKTPIYLTREELKWTLTPEDSVVWLTNDQLLRFQVTNQRFISNYEIERDADVHVLTSFEIYNRVYKNDAPQDLQLLQRQYFDIAEKYRHPDNDYNDYWNYNTDPSSVAAVKYKTGQVSMGISHICERLYRWEEDEMLIGSLHTLYYISMFLGLCLFIFRHSTIRTFFLSVLTGILLAIITGIVVAIGDLREEGALIMALVYFAFFLIFSLATINLRVRSVFTGIALNLAVICTPFIPLFSVLLYHEFNQINSVYDSYYYDDSYYQTHRDTRLLHIYIAQAMGFVILLIMIETVYKWMFRKWYAAPEE
jgi:hypothetical protein